MKVSFEINPRIALRWLLGILLIWAALGKLANLQEFYGSILGYKLPLPSLFWRGVAIVLPWLELLCGLALIARIRSGAALAWSLTLFSLFVLATGQAWIRGLEISCGCLDLRLLGIARESELAKIFESVGFAFLRAAALALGAFYLLRIELWPKEPAVRAEVSR